MISASTHAIAESGQRQLGVQNILEKDMRMTHSNNAFERVKRGHRRSSPVIAAGIAFFTLESSAIAQESRAEIIRQEQAARSQQLQPPQVNGVERVLDQLEDWGFIEGEPRGCVSLGRLGLSGWRLRRWRGFPQTIWRRWRAECVRRLFNRDVLPCRGHCGTPQCLEQSSAGHLHRPVHRRARRALLRRRRLVAQRGRDPVRIHPDHSWRSCGLRCQQVLLGGRRCRVRPCRDLQRADESIHRRRVLAGEHPGTRALDLQVREELGPSGVRLAPAARLLWQRRALSRAVRRFRRARPRPLLVQVARSRGPCS